MANGLYRAYDNDAAKMKVYKRRMKAAEADFLKWKPLAKDWFSRYRNERKLEQETPDGHRVNPVTGVAVIDALFSALTAVEVSTTVNNIGQGTRDQAYLATEALKQEWRHTKVMRKSEKTIKDALIAGIGWIKVGYEYREETKTIVRAQADVNQDIDALYAAARAEGKQIPSPEDAISQVPMTEVRPVVLQDEIVVDYVKWSDMRWDPTSLTAEDLRWVCQVTKVPLWEVQANPVFQAYCARQNGGTTNLKQLQADSKPKTLVSTDAVGVGQETSRDMTVDNDPTSSQDDLVTVYEMWDFESGTVCTYAKNADDWLLNESVNPFGLNSALEDRNPFVPLVLRSRDNHLRGIADMELMAPSLDELNLYKNNIATYIDRFVPKIMGPGRGMTENGKAALRSREYGAFVELTEGVTKNDYQALEPPALPTELFRMPDTIDQEIKDATGMNELMQGLFPDRRRTATETAEVVSASQARQAEKRNRLTHFYEDVARRVLQLMQIFYDEARISRVVDKTEDVVWTWTAEDIDFEYDLDLALEPREIRTKDDRRQDALAVLNVAAPLQPFVDTYELATWFFEEFGIERGVVRDLVKTPQQIQEEIQQIDQQNTQAQAQLQAQQAPAQPGQGPLSPQMMEAAAGTGAVPQQELVASQSPGNPFTAQGTQDVSESKGIQDLATQ